MSNADSRTVELIYSELAIEDPAFVEVVNIFVKGLSNRLEAMHSSFEKNDFDSLRRQAHQLKGSGGGHGYPLLTDKAAELEQQAQAGAVEEVKRSIEEMAELITRVRVAP